VVVEPDIVSAAALESRLNSLAEDIVMARALLQGMSTAEHKWKVLLDAAAFVPTQPLDLSVFPADFVSISFYKMLGFPTGLGALIVRSSPRSICSVCCLCGVLHEF
jgi:hypothetical protein